MSIQPLTGIRPLIGALQRPRLRPPTLSLVQARHAVARYWFAPRFSVHVHANTRVTQPIGLLHLPRIGPPMYAETRWHTPLNRVLNISLGQVRTERLLQHRNTHTEVEHPRMPTLAPRESAGKPGGYAARQVLTPARRVQPTAMVLRRPPSAAVSEPALAGANDSRIQPSTDWERQDDAWPRRGTPAAAIELSPPLIGRLTDEVIRSIDRRMLSHRERMGRV